MQKKAEYAGFWIRLAAYLIDYIISEVLSIIAMIVVILPFTLAPEELRGAGTAAGFMAYIAAYWLYFALMESSRMQATIGKTAVGIKVTDMQGRRISFARATGRFFAKILSSLAFLVGYIMIAFTEKKQGLHDMIAQTVVVKK